MIFNASDNIEILFATLVYVASGPFAKIILAYLCTIWLIPSLLSFAVKQLTRSRGHANLINFIARQGLGYLFRLCAETARASGRRVKIARHFAVARIRSYQPLSRTKPRRSVVDLEYERPSRLSRARTPGACKVIPFSLIVN